MKHLFKIFATAAAAALTLISCGGADSAVTADEPQYAGYLFAYFEGSGEAEKQEQLRFALSTDAVNWTALNGNRPIIASDTISKSGGIRDPHILRGMSFNLVASDLFPLIYAWG